MSILNQIAGTVPPSTVQENGFNAVISDDFSKMFQNATKVLLRLSDNDGA